MSSLGSQADKKISSAAVQRYARAKYPYEASKARAGHWPIFKEGDRFLIIAESDSLEYYEAEKVGCEELGIKRVLKSFIELEDSKQGCAIDAERLAASAYAGAAGPSLQEEPRQQDGSVASTTVVNDFGERKRKPGGEVASARVGEGGDQSQGKHDGRQDSTKRKPDGVDLVARVVDAGLGQNGRQDDDDDDEVEIVAVYKESESPGKRDLAQGLAPPAAARRQNPPIRSREAAATRQDEVESPGKRNSQQGSPAAARRQDPPARACAGASPGRTEGGEEVGSFGSEHLAEALAAAFSTKRSMRDFVSALKGKNGDAFRTVQLSSRAEGNYSNRQIASRIAECKVGAGQTAEELLGWLTESRLVSKSDLHEAMDGVKPAVKHRKSDNMNALMKTLVEGMRGRVVQAATETGEEEVGAKRLSEGGAGGEEEVKRQRSESLGGGAIGDGAANGGGGRAEGGGGGEKVSEEGQELPKCTTARQEEVEDSDDGARREEGAASPEAGASAAAPPGRTEGGEEVGSFGSEHLAEALAAAFSTKKSMRDFVSALKGKNGDAFRTVQLSSRAEGNYSNRQIASRIAECKVGAGQTAEELLGWLTESRLVSKSDLHEAMDRVKPAVKHRKSDNMNAMMKTLVEGMRGRVVQAATETGEEDVGAKRLSEGGAGGEEEVKKQRSELLHGGEEKLDAANGGSRVVGDTDGGVMVSPWTLKRRGDDESSSQIEAPDAVQRLSAVSCQSTQQVHACAASASLSQQSSASDGYHSEAGGGVDGKKSFTEEAGATAKYGCHEETQTKDQAGEESAQCWMLQFQDGRVVPLHDGNFSIGRGESNNLSLADPRVSQSHCRLTCSKVSSCVTLTDISTNGTFVGENRVHRCARKIRAGDLVEVVKGLKEASFVLRSQPQGIDDVSSDAAKGELLSRLQSKGLSEGTCNKVLARDSALGVSSLSDLSYLNKRDIARLQLPVVDARKLEELVDEIDRESSRGRVPLPHAELQGKMDSTIPRFALTIGNNGYEHFNKLSKCLHDAKSMARELEKHDFKVQTVLDVGKNELEKAIDDWSTSLPVQSPCVALIHFSGHGLEIGGENFVVPIDANDEWSQDDIRSNCISIQKVLADIKNKLGSSVSIFLFLDCCRENPTKTIKFKSSFAHPSVKTRSAHPSHTDMSVDLSRSFIAFATAPGKLARDSHHKCPNLSPFTYALVDCLKRREIAAKDIESGFMRAVRALVEDLTMNKQCPFHESNLRNSFSFQK